MNILRLKNIVAKHQQLSHQMLVAYTRPLFSLIQKNSSLVSVTVTVTYLIFRRVGLSFGFSTNQIFFSVLFTMRIGPYLLLLSQM